MSADLANILLAARADPAHRPAGLPMAPPDAAEAYAIQALIQSHLGPIGGWKVGLSPAGVFTCAPLPASHVMPSPAHVNQAECPDRGVEAEIAVRIGTDLPPRETPYTRDDVLAAIASAHPAIELLQSRYADVNAVDPLTNLADSLSHYGFVWGDAIEGWQSIDLVAETVGVVVDGTEIKRCQGNPAGDMIDLVIWLANHGSHWAGGLQAGQFVTTGSWTAKDFVPAGAHVRMVFDHCGSVEATYA
jgi:2-keto-4-pentenoate hydratase